MNMPPDPVDPDDPLAGIVYGTGARNRNKTHCPRGHPFSPENTYITTRGSRSCRACGHAHQKAYRERLKREWEEANGGPRVSRRIPRRHHTQRPG